MITIEQIEERMRKLYEDKAEAASKTYNKVLYESPPPLSDEEKREIARKKRQEEIEGKKRIVEGKKRIVEDKIKIEPKVPAASFTIKRKLTPTEEAEEREFWAAYRREKEKQKHEQRR